MAGWSRQTDAVNEQSTGRNVVITGAGRGLGLGLVRCFVERGDHVVGTARTPESSTDLADLAADVVELDVASDSSITGAAERLAQLGHIDILINNAGINATAAGAGTDDRGPFDIGRAEFMTVMDVNAAGPMLVTRALLPLLRASESSLVVNISSQLGAMTFGNRAGNDLAYNASKAALNMVTVRTASELESDGVALVCVHPGWVQTDMGGAAASLTIEESASSIASTVDGLSMADSGRFMRWDGTDHDW